MVVSFYESERILCHKVANLLPVGRGTKKTKPEDQRFVSGVLVAYSGRRFCIFDNA